MIQVCLNTRLIGSRNPFKLHLVHFKLDWDRVLACKAAVAEGSCFGLNRISQSIHAQISQRIGANCIPDLIDRLLGGDQFVDSRHVDTKVAGGDDWR